MLTIGGEHAVEAGAEGHQVLGVARLAAQPQEPVLQTAAFQVIVELPLDIVRQFPTLLRQMGDERRVMLFDDPIEKGLLGPMALVTTNATHLAGSPCPSVVGHDPRPCDTVYSYSLSLVRLVMQSRKPLKSVVLGKPQRSVSMSSDPLLSIAHRVVWFILMTGCREHEVLPVRDKDSKQLVGGLKWCHEVKLPNGLFVFDMSTPKNAKPKRIFLNSVAREIVDSCRGDHPEYVFVYKGRLDDGTGRPFQKVNNTAWKRARKEAGLENVRGPGQHFRVHDLRHTTGARLREEGVSREDRKDILGHANDDITTHYSTAETTYLVERTVSSKRPSLYLVKNTPATHSKNGHSENVPSV